MVRDGVDVRRLLDSTEVTRRVWRWVTHQRTGIYLLSYPKCGRTWLRLMIGKALVDDLNLTADPMEISQLHRHTPHVPRIRAIHDGSSWSKRPDELERNKDEFSRKKVIFLVRDPRDTLISMYFQATKRRDFFSGTPSQFLRHDVGALDTIIAYYNTWAENRNVPRELCLIRYEDLHREPVRELERALKVIGRVPRREILERAVEFAKFDNMRALERGGQLGLRDRDRLSPTDVNDPESFKTRKGKVGGFRDYLDEADVAYMNERIATQLSPFYASYLEPR